MSNEGRRIDGLDGLRGLAATAVMLCHFSGFILLLGVPVGTVGGRVASALSFGHLGVPVFFVLSGYVIAMTASRYNFTPSIGGHFLLRRLVRIAPPYWAMIALICLAIVSGKAIGVFRNTTVTAGQLAAHFAYLQFILDFPPLDIAHWTLCLEVQFYFVFVLTAVAIRRLPPGQQFSSFAILAIGSMLVEALDLVPIAWFPRLWYQFGLGVLTFNAGRNRSASFTLIALLAVVFGLGVAFGQIANAVVGIASIILFNIQRLRQTPRLLLGLGRISYSIYLVHGLVGMGLGAAFRLLPIETEEAAWCAIALSTAIALAFAAAFYYVFERQSIVWSRLVQIGPPRISDHVRSIRSTGHDAPSDAKTLS